MNIYFVRHGQTEFNASNTYQPLDSKLSEKGIEQAQFVANRFKDIEIDVVFSSDLNRAVQTAEIINTHVKKEHIQLENLRECKKPSVLIGKSRSDPFSIDLMNELDSHSDDPSWHHSDEDNFSDAKSRAIRVLQMLSERGEEHILVVTHGEFLRLLISIILLGESLTPKEFKNIQFRLKTTNTGVTVCHKEDKGYRLLTWNDHAHLP